MKLIINGNYGRNLIFNLYFLSILLMAISGNNILWRSLMIIGTIWGVLYDREKILIKFLFPLLLCIGSSIINMVIVGNMSLAKLMLMCLSWGMAIFISNTKIDTKMLRITLTLSNLILLIEMYLNGFRDISFFKGASYNYISIYSLLPIITYYFFAEKNNEDIKVWPSILGAIICILGYGRGGILTSFFILFGVVTRVLLFNGEKVTVKKIFIVGSLLLCMICFLISYEQIQSIVYFEKLFKYGLNSRGRGEIWAGYIRETMNNFEFLLFGTDTKRVYELNRYNGNVHNAFINVHVYNGITIFIWYVISIIAVLRKLVINKKLISLTAFFALLIRSFTDNFLWCSTGMVLILLFFIEEKI